MVVSGSQRESVTKRIGNAYNVLAVFYMNMAVTNLNSGRGMIINRYRLILINSVKVKVASNDALSVVQVLYNCDVKGHLAFCRSR